MSFSASTLDERRIGLAAFKSIPMYRVHPTD